MTTPTLPISHPFTTVCDLLRYAVSCSIAAGLIFNYGSEDAYDKAAYLVLHTLHLPIDTLRPFLDTCLPPEEVATMLRVIERRAVDRVSAAYITHEAFTHGMRSCVDERVIVPHSFIDELLEGGLRPWISQGDDPTDVLELYTGSDYLLILTASQWPNSTIDAVDLSPDALVVANRNVGEYHLRDRTRLREGDPCASLPLGTHYDAILTDPPYMNEASMQTLSPEYRVKPHMTLTGGDDSMDVIRHILADAPYRLKPRSVLVVEVGDERESVEATSPDLDLAWLPTSVGENQVFLVARETS